MPICCDTSNSTSIILLEELLLEGNFLSGTLPSEMSNLNQLDTLELSFNLLSGVVPENLTSTASLGTYTFWLVSLLLVSLLSNPLLYFFSKLGTI